MPFTEQAAAWAREGPYTLDEVVTRLAAACLDDWLAVHGVPHEWTHDTDATEFAVGVMAVQVVATHDTGMPKNVPPMPENRADYWAWLHYETGANRMHFLNVLYAGGAMPPIDWRKRMADAPRTQNKGTRSDAGGRNG